MKMDKKPDSSTTPPPPPSTVGDYDDNQSTYTVDQPPPAYRKPEVPSVKLAKIVAATILLVTFIIGLTSVAIVYVQHNMKCAEMIVIQGGSGRSGDGDIELPEAAKLANRVNNNNNGNDKDDRDDGSMFPDMVDSESDNKVKQLNFPIHIDMDELTGRMMDKNQRARLNCVIEKKRSEEIIPRAPKTLQTPFGNLTTDPKFTHVTGETMSLTCRSNNDRVSKEPTINSRDNSNPGSPILIQIPFQQQRGGRPSGRLFPRPAQMRPIMPTPPQQQQQQQQNGPPMSNLPTLLGPLQALHEIQRMHQQRQQQEQQQRLHGGQRDRVFLEQEQEQEDQQQEQQRFIPQLTRQFPMSMLPLPQISLHQMIPQLLEVHKQLQQERRREEQQQQQQHEQEQAEQRKANQNNNNNNNRMRNDQEESNRNQEREHEIRIAEGRTINMHGMIPLQSRDPPPHPPPPPPPNHVEEFFGGPFHQQQHLPQQHMDQNRAVNGEEHLQESQHIPLPHHVDPHGGPQRSSESTDETESDEGLRKDQHPHQLDVGIQLNVAPNPFHDGPQIVPADMMMMSRAMQHPAAASSQPAPFLVGSHNMQPRSSARPDRMKREAMAGKCSCVCK